VKGALLDWLRIEFGLSRWRWFRAFYGGRWERHYIDICRASIWLPMSPDPARHWPAYRQPCSVGEPQIEDYPVRA